MEALLPERCPLRANNFKSCPAKWSITVSVPFPNHLGSIHVCPNFSCWEVERLKSERSQLVFVIFLKVKDTFWRKVSFGRREEVCTVFQVLAIFGFFRMLGCPVSKSVSCHKRLSGIEGQSGFARSGGEVWDFLISGEVRLENLFSKYGP